MAVSFKNDIQPFFGQYKGQMIWRFDVTDYDTMRANWQLVYTNISDPGNPMPPPPFSPFSQSVIDDFLKWKQDGFLP